MLFSLPSRLSLTKIILSSIDAFRPDIISVIVDDFSWIIQSISKNDSTRALYITICLLNITANSTFTSLLSLTTNRPHIYFTTQSNWSVWCVKVIKWSCLLVISMVNSTKQNTPVWWCSLNHQMDVMKDWTTEPLQHCSHKLMFKCSHQTYHVWYSQVSSSYIFILLCKVSGVTVWQHTSVSVVHSSTCSFSLLL